MNIADTYLQYRGMKLINGTPVQDDIRVILPAILMNMAYQTFCTEIRPHLTSGRLKQLRNYWKDAYTAYNKEFFAPFDVDQREVICDKMDAFCDSLSHDILVCKVATMNCISYLPFEKQKVIAALEFCNIISYYASVSYSEVFVRTVTKYGKTIGEKNGAIEAIGGLSRQIANTYAPEVLKHGRTENKGLESAYLALVGKIAKMIYADDDAQA